MSAVNWAKLLKTIDAEEPPALEVAERLADARGLDPATAQNRVYDAIDEGVLVEQGEGFGGVRLADAADVTEGVEVSGESEKEESAKAGLGAESPAPEAEASGPRDGEPATVESWGAIDFADTGADTYPPELLDVEQWMGRLAGEKMPFSPWADRDHPEAEPDKDARYKWGLAQNYVDGHTVAMAEDDPRLDGRVFIQREDDPYAFVDGDDVRDPDTGEIHPAFRAILEHLGITYADVSDSGAGVHAYYRGEIPLDGVPEAQFDIDTEPWGSNDDAPAVEIYPNKHVNVTTGDHLIGTGTHVAEWDDDALRAILQANGYADTPEPSAETSVNLDDHDPEATDADETTDEIKDVFYALDRLDARRVAADTIVHRWNDDATTSDDHRAFVPTWGRNANGTANIVNCERWLDTGGKGYGGVDVMAAIDCPDLPGYDHRSQPRELDGTDWFRAVDHLRDLGYAIPQLEADSEGTDEYDDDPRKVLATVDPCRAWDAAGRVVPEDLEDGTLPTTEDGEAFAAPDGEAVDVVRAVAIAEGVIDDAAEPLGDQYPEAYRLAREAYGAPLPEYYTESDAIAEFDALLDVIAEVTFEHLDGDALQSTITQRGDDVGGDAVLALDPAWRESESGESVLVFESGNVWDADTRRSLDALRFVALDSGLLDHPRDPLEGEHFTEAYRRLREEYNAPVPLWHPADNGTRDVTPQLPPSEELLDSADLDGVDTDTLEDTRAEVEALLDDRTADAGTPTVVTSLPATGKTTGTIKTARKRPLSYLAPRKELQAQALEKADSWGVEAEILPVFSDERVADEVLDGAVSHVRERGKSRLRDRWAVLKDALDDAGGDDEDAPEKGDIFTDEDTESVDLDRPTCETADGDHGVAWALAVHVARRLGYTPREIHTQARGLFGAELPCACDQAECSYSRGWDSVTDPDDPADLLIGSYVHAHVESVRTEYDRDPSGDRVKRRRAVVLDEFPGEAYSREFGEAALDHATWLASCLREDVEDRRDMIDTDLYGDDWVRAWLDGDADETDAVGDVTDTLARAGDLLDARDAAGEIRERYERRLLRDLGLADPLERICEGDPAAAYRDLKAAVGDVPPEHPRYGVVEWASEDILDPLGPATHHGAGTPDPEAIDTDCSPFDGDLAALVEDAAEAARDGSDTAREAIAAATTALRGGREGCRRLAAWADDGYAHPDAHHLLAGVITPTGADSDDPGARRIDTDCWAFDPDATDGTTLDVVDTGERSRAVVDRNDHGAILHTPPSRIAGNGEETPLVGLDATGRADLWTTALGEAVETDDVHTTPAERAEFLGDALDLRVIQAADRPRSYEGDPASKDTEGDVALLQAIDDEYAGIDAPRQRGEAAAPVGSPAAITTKGVRNVLEADPRLDDVVAQWENYGNVTGANDLGKHRLAAILGSQHYGDDAIERFCALAGREVDTDRAGGRGAALEYGDDLADEYLQHMREDQTMQAILRFARGDSGATVVARTSALREDLPVIGDAQVVQTWSETARTIAQQYRRLGDRFTVADVADATDVTKRQVRRVLAELDDAGYVNLVGGGDGVAKEYDPVHEPGTGEVSLPERGDAVEVGAEPGRPPTNQYYTWNVRVHGGDRRRERARDRAEWVTRHAPPAPTTTDGVEPPG
jgi:hypothetical protein